MSEKIQIRVNVVGDDDDLYEYQLRDEQRGHTVSLDYLNGRTIEYVEIDEVNIIMTLILEEKRNGF